MTLLQCWRAECPRCHIHRYVLADSEAAARADLQALGWTDLCIRCTLQGTP